MDNDARLAKFDTKPWPKSGECSFMGTNLTRKIEPGLFWYSGFGWGTLYLPGNVAVWCNSGDARQLCREFDLKIEDVDSFRHYSGTYLGD